MNIYKEGFRLGKDSLKLVYIVFLWTLATLAFSAVDVSKISQQNLLWIFLIVLLVENFLTSCVYGSIKDIVSSVQFEWKKFFHYGSHYFMRFLGLKFILVFLLVSIYFLSNALVESLKYIPLSLHILFYLVYIIFILWMAFPVYFVSLLFFAPLVIFLEDCYMITGLKKSFVFVRENLGDMIVVSFLFGLIIFFVNFPFVIYNLHVWWWLFFKSVILSFAEVGFIRTYFYLYKRSVHK